jgi:RNA polymerase sigma-70 factor (ECF subfamily)
MDESQLIEAAQRDPRHFAELYDSHFDRIYAYAVMRTHDREAAQDITSQVFHEALANLAKFEWRGVPFAAWLYRIASNAIADHAKRNAREQANLPEEVASSSDVENAEQRAEIWQLMRDLPDDQRRVIKLRFVEERSIRDIAKDLGRSEGAVKQLQFRALQNIRDRARDRAREASERNV